MAEQRSYKDKKPQQMTSEDEMQKNIDKLISTVCCAENEEQAMDNWRKIVPYVVLGMQAFVLMMYFLRFYVFDTNWSWLEFAVMATLSGSIAIMMLISHRMAAKDPGFIDAIPNQQLSADDVQCKKCEGFKNELIHHSRHNNKCVFMMDHFCIWTNQCVGYLTMKPFALFCFYSCLNASLGVCFAMYRLAGIHLAQSVTDIPSLMTGKSRYTNGARQLAFGICQITLMMTFYASYMLWKLYKCVKRNSSLIDEVKRLHGRGKSTEPRPLRTPRQTISLILGQSEINLDAFIPINKRPKMTLDLLRKAELEMYDTCQRVNQPYAQCDRSVIKI